MTFAIVGSLVVLPAVVPWSIGAVCVAPAPSIEPFRNPDVSMSVSASRTGSSRTAKSSRSVITSPPFIHLRGVCARDRGGSGTRALSNVVVTAWNIEGLWQRRCGLVLYGALFVIAARNRDPSSRRIGQDHQGDRCRALHRGEHR